MKRYTFKYNHLEGLHNIYDPDGKYIYSRKTEMKARNNVNHLNKMLRKQIKERENAMQVLEDVFAEIESCVKSVFTDYKHATVQINHDKHNGWSVILSGYGELTQLSSMSLLELLAKAHDLSGDDN